MKKILLLSLITALSITTFSTTAEVKAQLNVVDPEAEISLNISSTSATFGDVLITQGQKKLSKEINFALEGTGSKTAEITLPIKIQLKGVNGATLDMVTSMTSTNSGDLTVTKAGDNFIAKTSTAMNTKNKVEGKIGGTLSLLGTEVSGRYVGTIPLTAKYN